MMQWYHMVKIVTHKIHLLCCTKIQIFYEAALGLLGTFSISFVTYKRTQILALAELVVGFNKNCANMPGLMYNYDRFEA